MQIAYSHIHHVLIECQMIQHFITGLSDSSITFPLIRKYNEHEKLLIEHFTAKTGSPYWNLISAVIIADPSWKLDTVLEYVSTYIYLLLGSVSSLQFHCISCDIHEQASLGVISELKGWTFHLLRNGSLFENLVSWMECLVGSW